MFPFFVSLIFALLIRRAWLRPSSAISMAILFGLSMYGLCIDPKKVALLDQSQVNFYVWSNVALSIAEVFAAFLLAWGIRRLFSSRKKASK